MSTFLFIMQHKPTLEQLDAARAMGVERIVALAPTKPEDRIDGVEYFGSVSLLNVPDDPTLPREWFVTQAEKILSTLGGIKPNDVVHTMGQQQLTVALNAIARRQGSRLIESVTRRESVDRPQSDGTVKKETIFRFAGYREVYEF